MKTEALSAGYYKSEYFNVSVPKIQILTIEELLSGEKPKYYRVPGSSGGATLKAAPRKYKDEPSQVNLLDN